MHLCTFCQSGACKCNPFVREVVYNGHHNLHFCMNCLGEVRCHFCKGKPVMIQLDNKMQAMWTVCDNHQCQVKSDNMAIAIGLREIVFDRVLIVTFSKLITKQINYDRWVEREYRFN